MAEPSEETTLQRKGVTDTLRNAPVWGHVQKALGWEGLSFAFIATFAFVLIQLEHYQAARYALSFSVLILALKLVLSSRKYLSSKFWKPVSYVGSVVIATAYLIGTLYWVAWEEAKHEHRQPPSLDDWFLPAASYMWSLPWTWILISLAVGFLLAAWLVKTIQERETEIKNLTEQAEVWTHLKK
jgi:hypothetical protein